MTPIVIAWILWSFDLKGNMLPIDGYATLADCRTDKAMFLKKQDRPDAPDWLKAESFSCFPHTFDPRPVTR